MILKNGAELSADPLGYDTYYYAKRNGILVINKNLKEILANQETKIDKKSLASYFTHGFIPSGHTLIRDVKRIPYGSKIEYEKNKLNINKNFEYNWQKIDKSRKWFKKEIRRILFDSVKNSLNNNDKIGLLLSGGLDSAIILAVLNEFKEDITTFTVGTEWAHNDEFKKSRQISEYFGTNHKEIIIERDDFPKILFDIVSNLEVPHNSLFMVGVYKTIKIAEKMKINKIYTGNGSDVMFGGYGNLSSMIKISDLLPINAKKILQKISVYFGDSKFRKGLSVLSMKEPYQYLCYGGIQDQRVYEYLIKKKNSRYFLKSSNYNKMGPLDRIYDYDLFEFYPNGLIQKHLQFSKQNSVIITFPFWNLNLVNLATKIPWNFQIKNKKVKFILRQTFKDLLPNDILNVKKRPPRTNPSDFINKGGLNKVLNNLINDNNHGLYNDIDSVKKLITKSKKPLVARDLWTILIFEIWYNTFVKK